MKISYSKSFEKKFSKYDRKLQEKIYRDENSDYSQNMLD